MEEEKIDEAMIALYDGYGSSSGFLFGIPPNLKFAVRAVIKVILMNEDKIKNDNDNN